MINNIRFKIIAGKINKIANIYTIFARKMPNYILIRQWDRGQAEAKCLRPRLRPRPKFWPWGHFGLEDLTSLRHTRSNSTASALAIMFSCHADRFTDYKWYFIQVRHWLLTCQILWMLTVQATTKVTADRLTSRILTCTELKGALFVCFSFWLNVCAVYRTQLSSPR